MSLCFLFLQSGATNPEYIVTADDVDKIIAVDCIPMDDQGRQVSITLYMHALVLILSLYFCVCTIAKICNSLYVSYLSR